MNKLLFEIGVEELPSSEYSNIELQLEEIIRSELKTRNIEFSDIETVVAPRRFGAVVCGLSDKEPDTFTEKKGPARNLCFAEDGSPSRAFEGFLKSSGATVDQVIFKEINGIEYAHVKIDKKGKKTKELFEQILGPAITKMNFKKPMRWGKGEYSFVRPVHWVLALYNDEIMNIEIFGKKSSNKTYGHRFFGREEIINNADEYFSKLRSSFVIARLSERVEKISTELSRIEKESGYTCDRDKELIDEIAKLTEYPTAVVGSFDEKYSYLPPEITTVTIKHHQRSFLALKDGKATNKYISFQDGYSREKNVVTGYSRVINARLDDAAFYFNDDLKAVVQERFEQLSGVTYQQGLGTYKDKAERISAICAIIAERMGFKGNEVEKIKRAGLLCKIDITSNVVFEFPEVVGSMGRIFLKAKNEEEDICTAAQEHYQPKDESDRTSSNITANIVSIADKADDIAGYFGINKIPSGSKDPFALRRKAFGIIRILIDNEWDFDIKDILKIVSDNLNMKYDCEKMDEFFKSRFETILLKEEMPRDVINAVLVNWNRPLRAYLAAQSIKEYLSLDKFKDFITAFQRIYNISKSHNSMQYQGRLFVLEQEKELFQKYLEVRSGYESCVKEMNFKGVIDVLIEMKPQIDNYFEGVFVMDRDESIRLNRLGFLKTLSGMFSEIGDVSRLYQ